MAGLPRMIFFNIGWMERYQGPDGEVGTLGNHRHLQENKFGYECFNFRPVAGKCYGYRPASSNIRIENIGAQKDALFFDDVTVVWIARDPSLSKSFIVGWYNHARIFRKEQFLPRGLSRQLEGNEVGYYVVAPEKNVFLVPTIARTFRIPTKRDMSGGLGQSTIWYGANDNFRRSVWRYIQRCEIRGTLGGKMRRTTEHISGWRNQNPEQREKIESTAIRVAIEYFSSNFGGNYSVTSKEKDNLGWDLEAFSPISGTLLIEVKGLSGSIVNVQLTPNEYEKMSSSKLRSRYVLFIVTDCLGMRPSVHDYRFEGDVWVRADGTALKVVERTGAICRSGE